MIFLWVIFLALTNVKSIKQNMSESHEVKDLVAFGDIYSPEEYPYVVCILNFKSSAKTTICTGTLISDKFVLTAGHCTVDKNVYKTTVFRGTCGKNINQRREVIRFHQPKSFNLLLLTSDISLLELNEPFEHVSEFANIRSTDPSILENNGKLSCVVIGFGRTHDQSLTLGSQGHLAHVITKKCEKACELGIKDRKRLLCLVSSYRSYKYTICPGDNGGPLICNGIQYGVASYGFKKTDSGNVTECSSPEIQDVHVFVYFYKDWIFDTTGLTKDKGPITRLNRLLIVLVYSYYSYIVN